MDNNSSKHHDQRQNPSNLKRTHPDDRTSPKTGPKVAKTPAPNITTDNNENTNIHVAITTSNGSDLSQAELDSIRIKTEKMYLDFYNDNHDNYPKFVSEPVIDNGVMKLICLNEFTKEWLQKKICDLKINCAPEKLPLKLVLQKDLPTKIRFGFTLTNFIAPNRLQLTLHKMNPQAGVDKWSIYSVTKTDSGSYVEVGIPSELLPSIEKDDLRIGFQSIKLNVINEKERKQAIATNPANNLDEAGPSEPKISSRRHGDRDSSHQRPRTSIIEPITERDDSRRRGRSSPDENNYSDALSDFLRFSRDQARFPDFVRKKCQLAERAVGTNITEQHLVLAFLTSLQEKRITRDLLMNRTPKTLKELLENINYYHYCQRCDKIGHIPEKCWSSND